MLAYRGEDKGELESLFSCLVRSAKKDPITGDVHGDGWGVVAYTDAGTLIHYRSALPIFEDNKANKVLELLEGKMWVIAHARLATDKSLVDAKFSHPYLETTPDELIYVAHNGSVDKEGLGRYLGIDAKYMVDSELIGKFFVKEGLDQLSLDKLKGFTRSALNVFILRVPRNSREPKLYYLNFYRQEYIEKRGIPEEYYKLYRKNNAVFSSSLAYFCGKGSQVEVGKLDEV